MATSINDDMWWPATDSGTVIDLEEDSGFSSSFLNDDGSDSGTDDVDNSLD
jgi:hypothetical protein